MDIAIYHDQIANIFNLTMVMPIFITIEKALYYSLLSSILVKKQALSILAGMIL